MQLKIPIFLSIFKISINMDHPCIACIPSTAKKSKFHCLSPVRLDAKDAQMHVQAFSLRKYTSHHHLPDYSLQDYIIILLYLDYMTSSGQFENSKLYNSVSFGPNKNWFGQVDQTTKRSISTKGIRNRGKFEPSISVAQKWWCLGVSHHRKCRSSWAGPRDRQIAASLQASACAKHAFVWWSIVLPISSPTVNG